jgi:predicted  nucleic acid-binding Zn-ribbon protein
MDDIQRIMNKLDEIDDAIKSIEITLVKQQAILEEHQRRSLANEEAVEILRKQMKPIEDHVFLINSVFKGIIFLSFLVGIAQGIKELL